jgi:hypothetical protein
MNILDYFDELVLLAKDNPTAFEARKKEILEEYFSTLDEEKQILARRRQWRLDQELNKHPSGINRYNAMVVEFWSGFSQFQKALNGLNEPAPVSKATVIDFKKE